MARSKLLVFFALILLISIPAGLAQAQSTNGTAVISDGNTYSDKLTISLMDVSDPGEGMVYVAWLVSDDGSIKLNVGALNVDSKGAVNHGYLSPSGENLIATYNKAVVTNEAAADAEAADPKGEIAFSTGVSPAAMMYIRNLLMMFPDDGEMGILSNLRGQLAVAIEHARLARSAADIDSLMMHTQHVINVIEGTDGANFDDSGGNPGDGMGVLAHAMGRDQAAMAAAAAAGNELIQAKALLVEEYAGNAEMWAMEARDNALSSMAETDLLKAKNLLSTVSGPLNSALDGIAATGAGGASQAYVEAQLMATYDFAAGVPEDPIVDEPVVGDSDLRVLAQVGLIAALALLLSGSIALARARRRSRG